jgi:hypothetical protein
MRLLPHQTFTIETKLAPKEVESRLSRAVEQRRWRHPSGHGPFEGAFDGSRFEMRRIIHYRNSFLPQVRGVIEPAGEGTRLVGTMRLHGAVIAFMTLWFGGVLFASSVVLQPLFAGRKFDSAGFIPLGMLVFGVALVLVGFIPESRKALGELARVVDASRADFR